MLWTTRGSLLSRVYKNYRDTIQAILNLTKKEVGPDYERTYIGDKPIYRRGSVTASNQINESSEAFVRTTQNNHHCGLQAGIIPSTTLF